MGKIQMQKCGIKTSRKVKSTSRVKSGSRPDGERTYFNKLLRKFSYNLSNKHQQQVESLKIREMAITDNRNFPQHNTEFIQQNPIKRCAQYVEQNISGAVTDSRRSFRETLKNSRILRMATPQKAPAREENNPLVGVSGPHFQEIL